MHRFRVGKRIIKTAAAVFVTALLCEWMGWPVIFAVIAAIVTIEPTVNGSISKGLIRLPSAAIGAFFAMLFDYLMGQQPATYALSALATIYVIQLLRWNDSLLVATLTSVNMITMTDADFMTNFLVRLGTTSTGIIVSALINYTIFPPNYMAQIKQQIPQRMKNTLMLTHHIVERSLTTASDTGTSILLRKLKRTQAAINLTMMLISFQRADARYHRFSYATMKEMVRLEHLLHSLQHIIHYNEGLLSYPCYRATAETRDWLWKEWNAEFPRTATVDSSMPPQLHPRWPNKDSHELFVICQVEALLSIIHKLPAEYVNALSLRKELAEGTVTGSPL